jgi:hypothetical protein
MLDFSRSARIGEALRDAELILDLAHGGQSSIGAKMRSHQSPVSRASAALKAKNSAASAHASPHFRPKFPEQQKNPSGCVAF